MCAFLLMKMTKVLLISASRACLAPSPYLDTHGEEDLYLTRGRYCLECTHHMPQRLQPPFGYQETLVLKVDDHHSRHPALTGCVHACICARVYSCMSVDLFPLCECVCACVCPLGWEGGGGWH